MIRAIMWLGLVLNVLGMMFNLTVTAFILYDYGFISWTSLVVGVLNGVLAILVADYLKRTKQ